MNAPKNLSAGKTGLHPHNRHRQRYDFAALIASCPALAPHVRPNPYGDTSIDFADPAAVKALNQALLAHDYGLSAWDLPPGYLCPPIPGRADYVHRVAELLAGPGGAIPRGDTVRALDVGVGANAIYPLLGRVLYGWRFVGADIDAPALAHAQQLFAAHPQLGEGFEARLQPRRGQIFRGIIGAGEHFDLTLCNPPFHASAEEAARGTQRKLRNLGHATAGKPALNFGGRHHELWCPGGELAFLRQMIRESRDFARQCLWFTTLVSKRDHLPLLQAELARHAPRRVQILDMQQGQKSSRVLAWSFFDQTAQRSWPPRHE